jgi:hypothetical protein
MKRKEKSNWFETHPKKTLLIFLALVILALGYGAEKFLKYKHHGAGLNYALPNRAVALREWRPGMIIWESPEKAAKTSDSLTLKPYLLRIDQNGFIIPSKKYEHPDITLAFLGASTTEVRYVEEEHRFPYLTGRLLEKNLGINVNSYNAARSGNHSLHSLIVFLAKVLPLRPDIVVMMHNANDLAILLHDQMYWNDDSSRPTVIDMNKEIAQNSIRYFRDKWIPHLAAAMREFDHDVRFWLKSRNKPGLQPGEDEFAQYRGKRVVVDESQLVPPFAKNLQTFISICKSQGVTPVLMTMANRLKDNPDRAVTAEFEGRDIGYQEFKAAFDRFNEVIRQKGRENHITVIDLAKEIPPEKEYLYDIIHLNDNGSIMAAEIISRQLEPLVRQQMQKRRSVH